MTRINAGISKELSLSDFGVGDFGLVVDIDGSKAFFVVLSTYYDCNLKAIHKLLVFDNNFESIQEWFSDGSEMKGALFYECVVDSIDLRAIKN